MALPPTPPLPPALSLPPVALTLPPMPPIGGGTAFTGWSGPHLTENAPTTMHAAIEAIVLPIVDSFIGASISIPRSVTPDVRHPIQRESMMAQIPGPHRNIS